MGLLCLKQPGPTHNAANLQLLCLWTSIARQLTINSKQPRRRIDYGANFLWLESYEKGHELGTLHVREMVLLREEKNESNQKVNFTCCRNIQGVSIDTGACSASTQGNKGGHAFARGAPHKKHPYKMTETHTPSQHAMYIETRNKRLHQFTCTLFAWGAEDGERACWTALARLETVETIDCSVGPVCCAACKHTR